jgi:hypothetical protein
LREDACLVIIHFRDPTLGSQRRVSKESGYQDFSDFEIGSHEDRRSGISMVKVPGRIETVRLRRHMVEI